MESMMKRLLTFHKVGSRPAQVFLLSFFSGGIRDLYVQPTSWSRSWSSILVDGAQGMFWNILHLASWPMAKSLGAVPNIDVFANDPTDGRSGLRVNKHWGKWWKIPGFNRIMPRFWLGFPLGCQRAYHLDGSFPQLLQDIISFLPILISIADFPKTAPLVAAFRLLRVFRLQRFLADYDPRNKSRCPSEIFRADVWGPCSFSELKGMGNMLEIVGET